MSISREDVYTALLALLAPLLAPGAVDGFPDGKEPNGAQPGNPTVDQPFNLVSRETIEVQKVPPALQPVLFLDEAAEDFEFQGEGLTGRKWQVFLHIGCTSTRGTPAATLLNPLIDAVEQALIANDGTRVQRLNDDDGKPRVARVQINGTAIKNLMQNATSNVRQAVCYLPVEIVLAGRSN